MHDHFTHFSFFLHRGTFGPGSFLSKFLGNEQGSFFEFEAAFASDTAKQTSFAEFTAAFPASVTEYLARKGNDGVDIPRDIMTPNDCLKLANVRAAKGTSGVNQLSSLLWLEVAQVYLQEGLLIDAEAATSQAIKNNEIFAPALGLFGRIEEARNNFDAALSFYRRGLAIDSDDSICLLGAARVQLHRKVFIESEKFARRALEFDASIAEAWSIVAQNCAQSGRQDESERCFERALQQELIQPLRSYKIIN